MLKRIFSLESLSSPKTSVWLLKNATRLQIIPRRLCYFVCLPVLGLASFAQAGQLDISVFDSQNKIVADTVVYLEANFLPSSPRKKVIPNDIAQKDKKFMPLVSVVQTGSSISFPNNDTVRHHVYSFSPTKQFELKLYAGTPSAPVLFDKPGTVVLGCNIHDSMVAYIHIVDTPIFGITNSEGKVSFADLQPGSYVIKSWHYQTPNELASKPHTIQIKDRQQHNINLVFKLKTLIDPAKLSLY